MIIDSYAPRLSVIAFIDILGFRQLVANAFRESAESETQRARAALGDAVKALARSAQEQNALEEGHFRATTFSDSVVISDDLQGHGIERVLDTSSNFAAALLSRGFACRGGITSGLLIHDGQILLGPAMVSAYELENQAAVYPRIVIADSLALPSEERPGHWRVLRDQDGFRFLDVFYRIRSMDRDDPTPGSRLETVRMLIEAQLSAKLSPGVSAKWRWLAARFKADV